ncbi:MAG: hypothetical protein ABL962_18365, partial [Fimbriimonadaceae bacterium]
GMTMGPVVPALQAEDGSFVGWYISGTWDTGTPQVNTVAFDASGTVRWTVQNEVPEMATEGGGLIAASGTTYDENGSANGFIKPATLSSLGNSYQIGSVDLFVAPSIYIALSYWAFQGGNQAVKGAAIPNPQYPLLPSCTDTGNSCNSGPQPADLLWNAKQDLIRRLSNDDCKTLAKNEVLDKVTYGFWGNPVNPDNFINYLRNTFHFYNGSTSTLNMQDAMCGEGNSSGCGPKVILKDYFAGTSEPTAVTVTASHPLKSFWQPTFTSEGSGVFGIGIDPSSSGANIYNESALFHEALHGYTGLYDADLGTWYRLNVADAILHSVNISIYIKNHVLSQTACNF